MMSGAECYQQIDPVSGVLRIRKELDFEKQPFFNLTLFAEDRGVPSLSSQTFVEVEVRNTHAHTNTFLVPSYYLEDIH